MDATTLLFSALKVINRVRDETSSGGLLANDCLVHYSVSSLPFGGVGEYYRNTEHRTCTCARGSHDSL